MLSTDVTVFVDKEYPIEMGVVKLEGVPDSYTVSVYSVGSVHPYPSTRITFIIRTRNELFSFVEGLIGAFGVFVEGKEKKENDNPNDKIN
jgi:hypothetical protein